MPTTAANDVPQIGFRAVLELNGKTATGVVVPDEVITGLGAGKRVKVQATINGYSYRTSVAPMGGRFLLPVSAEARAAAGVAAGDMIDIGLAVDNQVRQLTVPADLAAALDADMAIRRRFDALSYSAQQRHVLPIESAKTEETRRRRIAKTVDDLTEGQR